MSDPKPQAEPTMEEILASIRRIISENDEEQEAKKRSENPAAPAASLAPPDFAEERVSNPASEPASVAAAVPPQPATPRTDAAVLELTDMIAEDGTVINLSTGKPYRPAAPEEARQSLAEDVASEAPKKKSADDQPLDKKPAPPPERAQNSENTMENPKDKADDVISANTAAAATATFAQLARTMAQEPQASNNMTVGSHTTIEDIVKEMLRPMLKEWLDQNLPKMVEHMVRRELDRMVRRAEDA